jgi:chemotaxis protein methyltransferase CheR
MITTGQMDAGIDLVTALLAERIGLRPEQSLRGRLRRCLRDEVTKHGGDLDGYIKALSASDDMLQSLVNGVTVQESGFFRHPDHFAVLAEHILPALDRPARMWSAGCANGQETYSLAMVLEETGTAGSVLATDLSTAALARTMRARYTTREIAGISPARRARHLSPEGVGWQVNASVRARVSTGRHNLDNAVPSSIADCQVIFCRNVLIYFSTDRAKVFLDRLAALMTPNAYLFLGSAESLWQTTDHLRAVRLGESFVYQRADRARKPTANPPVKKHKRAVQPAAPVPVRQPADPPPHPLHHAVEVSGAAQIALVAAAGQSALSGGNDVAAVVAFRQWVYLAPDDPLAALHLGLALEAGGHDVAAQRAFGVARAVTLQVGSERAEAALEGFTAEELLRLLDTKQGSTR